MQLFFSAVFLHSDSRSNRLTWNQERTCLPIISRIVQG